MRHDDTRQSRTCRDRSPANGAERSLHFIRVPRGQAAVAAVAAGAGEVGKPLLHRSPSRPRRSAWQAAAAEAVGEEEEAAAGEEPRQRHRS